MNRQTLNRRTLLSVLAVTGLGILGFNEWSCGGIFGRLHLISARNVDNTAHTLHIEIYCGQLEHRMKKSEQTIELPPDGSLHSVAEIKGKKRLVATNETGESITLITTSDIGGATIGIGVDGDMTIAIPA